MIVISMTTVRFDYGKFMCFGVLVFGCLPLWGDLLDITWHCSVCLNGDCILFKDESTNG